MLTYNKQLYSDNRKLYFTINIYNSGFGVNFTIIIHTGALVFTIKSYTGAKPPNGLAVRMVFNVGCGIAVAWNVLCDGIFYW